MTTEKRVRAAELRAYFEGITTMTTEQRISAAELRHYFEAITDRLTAIEDAVRAVQQELTHQQAPSPRPQGTSGPAQGRGGPSVIFALDPEGNNPDEVPCCSVHKTSTGTPRPLRWFGPVAKCTAKRRDGTYCELEHRP